jgi:hypothetical protein
MELVSVQLMKVEAGGIYSYPCALMANSTGTQELLLLFAYRTARAVSLRPQRELADTNRCNDEGSVNSRS